VQVRLDAIDVDELREFLIEVWRTCVPNRLSDADEQLHATGPAAPLTG
jgi:hypothetical protein